MNFLSLIEAKRDGGELSGAQIKAIVAAFTRGEIPDYQMSALLMAVYFRGLNARETRALTLSMRDSGEVLQWPQDARPVADKHSTGGIGDKVSLPLAPLLACLGLRVPMISGRGLGITGGTLDKLESIPGFNTRLEPARIISQVQEIGCCICGQTATMVPADKAIYALRDASATVPSIPLITASILSKKLAENLDALILDVKFGRAAFMQDMNQARELAQSMVNLGRDCGVSMRAILSDMDTPLGNACGNWLEVKESVECLEGRGPDDLRALVVECAAHLLAQTGLAADENEGRLKATACLDSGLPRAKWDEMLRAQDADLAAFERKLQQGDLAQVSRIEADQDGFLTRCDARTIGEVVRDLGGGRQTKDCQLDLNVGVEVLMKPGARVEKGAVLARLHGSANAQLAHLRKAFEIGEVAPLESSLVREILSC